MGGPGANTRPHQTNTRRPHTKSKLGCKTCKRRHIKCDQQKPQCRNCTKHNVRCDYMDEHESDAASSQKLGPPDLKMTREIEQHLRQWRETGVSPFPSLGVTVHPPLSEYSNTDLRLMYHISNIAAQMEKAESPQHSVWVSRVPLFLNLASKYKFVMHALLALSASHLGWLTESPGTLQLSYYHRGLALNGLQDTIGRFSMENSDAVLAASILLSWQATDWQGWAGIMRGTATVIEQMQAWKESSEFREYLEQNDLFNESPRPNAIGLPESQRILIHVHECLRKLEPFVQGKKEESKGLSDLMAFVRNIKTYLPFESEDEQFEHLHPLRSWLFFLPISFLKRAKEDPDVMMLLAHFYAVALAVEPIFPVVGSAWFGSLALGPIREIHKNLVQQAKNRSPSESHWPLSLMRFPLEAVQDFCIRMGWMRADEMNFPQDACEGEFPYSPNESEFGLTAGQPEVTSGESFDMDTLMGTDIDMLSNEDFYAAVLWRGWSMSPQ